MHNERQGERTAVLPGGAAVFPYPFIGFSAW